MEYLFVLSPSLQRCAAPNRKQVTSQRRRHVRARSLARASAGHPTWGSSPEERDCKDSDMVVEARTIAWVRVVVIGLNLCPFAEAAMERARVRIVVTRSQGERALEKTVADEIRKLEHTEREELETTLIVAPDFARDDFLRFHRFGDSLESWIESDDDLVDSVMLARFHPEHAWGDASPDDPVNFDKRAPYPIINLLRADQVDEYVEQGRTESILERNQHTLERVGYERLREMYKSLT